LLEGHSAFELDLRDLTILPARGDPPYPTILGLHGLAMRPEIYARWLAALMDGPWAFWIPEGTYPLERRLGDLRSIGFAWYLWEGDTPAFRESLRKSEARVLSLFDARAAERGLDTTRVVAVGFSQGAYFGGSLVLRHAERFRGLVVAGGRVRPGYAERKFEEIPRIPILFLHGRADDVVPLQGARESADELAGLGFPVTFVEVEGGHIWNESMSAALREWMDERFS
jgi:predicted esterase